MQFDGATQPHRKSGLGLHQLRSRCSPARVAACYRSSGFGSSSFFGFSSFVGGGVFFICSSKEVACSVASGVQEDGWREVVCLDVPQEQEDG